MDVPRYVTPCVSLACALLGTPSDKMYNETVLEIYAGSCGYTMHTDLYISFCTVNSGKFVFQTDLYSLKPNCEHSVQL